MRERWGSRVPRARSVNLPFRKAIPMSENTYQAAEMMRAEGERLHEESVPVAEHVAPAAEDGAPAGEAGR